MKIITILYQKPYICHVYGQYNLYKINVHPYPKKKNAVAICSLSDIPITSAGHSHADSGEADPITPIYPPPGICAACLSVLPILPATLSVPISPPLLPDSSTFLLYFKPSLYRSNQTPVHPNRQPEMQVQRNWRQ